jgi:hypothetical protein
MYVIGFLCVSLGSSTVQFQDSLGSTCACVSSEAGFSSKNGDRAWGVFYRRAAFYCAFLLANGLNANDKTLLCCGFPRTSIVAGQVYQCWWRICREINDFFQIWISHVLYPFVTYLLTLLRIRALFAWIDWNGEGEHLHKISQARNIRRIFSQFVS